MHPTKLFDILRLVALMLRMNWFTRCSHLVFIASRCECSAPEREKKKVLWNAFVVSDIIYALCSDFITVTFLKISKKIPLYCEALLFISTDISLSINGLWQ